MVIRTCSQGLAKPALSWEKSCSKMPKRGMVEAPGVTGARQVDVFRWIEGRQLGSVETSVSGDATTISDQYRKIGTLMARMHNQAAGWQPPAGFERHQWNEEGLVGEAPLWGRFWELADLTPGQRRLLISVREG